MGGGDAAGWGKARRGGGREEQGGQRDEKEAQHVEKGARNWNRSTSLISSVTENRGVVVTEAGSYLRRIDSCIARLKAQGSSRTCTESKKKKKKKLRGQRQRKPHLWGSRAAMASLHNLLGSRAAMARRICAMMQIDPSIHPKSHGPI